MKTLGKASADSKWLKALGVHVESLLKKQGYEPPYELWIQKGDERMSRTTLKYILNGETDPKITSLRILAKMLGVSLKELIDFE